MNLSQYIEKGDWDGLIRQLDKMTNSEFRRSEGIVREQMKKLSNNMFWEGYSRLVKYRKQSFLSCILSVGRLVKNDELDFVSEGALELARWTREESPESAAKILKMAIPLLSTENQMTGIRRLFDVADEKEWISILTKEETPLAYYMLFKALQTVENQDETYKCCLNLMRKGNDISYNMASIIKSYFGVDQLKTTFSLQVAPYELSFLDKSYENFEHILTGKRPKL